MDRFDVVLGLFLNSALPRSSSGAGKYASIHPDPAALARMPLLEDVDGTSLIESWIIMKYLDAKYPRMALLPKDPADVAKVCILLPWVTLFRKVGGGHVGCNPPHRRLSCSWSWQSQSVCQTREPSFEPTIHKQLRRQGSTLYPISK